MKKGLILIWLTLLFTMIVTLFWRNEYVYSLPTPVPKNLKAVRLGDDIDIPNILHSTSKPVFLHFFNPDCPCSKFNITHFKSLVKQYSNEITFVIVAMNKGTKTAKDIQNKFDLSLPVLFDKSIATSCGVYSTPQAVIISPDQKLYYRGNYNRARYCTDKKRNYAQQALDSLLHNRKVLFNQFARASIYTRPFDVEGEQNGLITYDREVIKIPFEELRKIHSLNKSIGTVPKITAQNADLTEPAQLYADLFQQYINGKKDAAFLKQLTMMAMQNNDAAGKNQFAAEYIATIQMPYRDDDFVFIEGSTKKVHDPGFAILIEREKELSGKDQRSLHVKLMNIIYADVIVPYVPGVEAKPDWDEISEKAKQYGSAGEEMYLRARMIHAYNQQDWGSYKTVAKEYLEKYGVFISAEEKKMFEEKLR